MNPSGKNIPASVRQRLTNLAKARGIEFQRILGWMGLNAWDKVQDRRSPEGLKVRELIEHSVQRRGCQLTLRALKKA